MIKRSFTAGVRAVLVTGLVMTPSVVFPGTAADSTQAIAFVALLAGILTFVEYAGAAPSLIDFRSAPPINRLRFVTLLALLLVVTAVVSDGTGHGGWGSQVAALAAPVGQALDFPFSPVHLLTIADPRNTASGVELVRDAAGLGLVLSSVAVILTLWILKTLDWPLNNGAFNVHVNLPMFDPTSGGDVLARMKRDAQINIALGFLMPFLTPALVGIVSPFVTLLSPAEPETLIWIVSLWAFLPTSLIIRGTALLRVAALIEEKRRRAYAQRGDDGLQIA
ncbi:hypothetical protein VK792_05525 [Mesobacterium sp. TK19101]|uniref:Uncharacterized protein n=1 Tax=Mesobacterium hydrothermale TaxID=3111907 RepID=A0ABU6HFH2_9RHOB|nr:hypothetical protein [Mesobacterium sp. TK19101]MEC3860736.1 hypothetical protein [Mesobacterium sp. TK19101]